MCGSDNMHSAGLLTAAGTKYPWNFYTNPVKWLFSEHTHTFKQSQKKKYRNQVAHCIYTLPSIQHM